MLSSGFFISLAPGATAAPNGFGCSKCGLWAVLAGREDAEDEDVKLGLELEENFELMLDIHEFLRPGERLGLESLEPFGAACADDAGFSVLSRVGRCGRGRWCAWWEASLSVLVLVAPLSASCFSFGSEVACVELCAGRASGVDALAVFWPCPNRHNVNKRLEHYVDCVVKSTGVVGLQ